MRKIIITGSAFSGKSSLINQLAKQGYKTVVESETKVLNGIVSRLGTEKAREWVKLNYSEFKEMVAEEQYLLNSLYEDFSRFVFFDRSSVCYIAFCKMRKAMVPEMLENLTSDLKPYKVFFFEMLPTFSVRREHGRFMKLEEARLLNDILLNEYLNRGYNPISVPVFSEVEQINIDKRIKFIESKIK